MDLPQLIALQTELGQAALAMATSRSPRIETFLVDLQALQKIYPLSLAKAALETALLRQKATSKFSRADRMYFTKDALEQAAHERISRYRARRFAGQTAIADLGCGIGGDSLALAAVGPLLAVEHDPLRLAMATINLASYAVQADCRCEELNTLDLPAHTAIWLDPARRQSQGRVHHLAAYQPPPSVWQYWQRRAPASGIKLSPAVEIASLPDFQGELEFISLAGELKEAVWWQGAAAGAAARRATLLTPNAIYTRTTPTSSLPTIACQKPGAILYEPDPAILRAGLVELLAVELAAQKLSVDIAYLTADHLQPHPFVRAFTVLADFPFALKRTRAELHARQVGRITVKKRGSPLDVAAFTQAMRLQGDPACELLVFLTQVLGQPWVILAKSALPDDGY